MPSLSYSELLGLMIAGAVVLFPLTQLDAAIDVEGAQHVAAVARSHGHAPAQLTCPRRTGE